MFSLDRLKYRLVESANDIQTHSRDPLHLAFSAHLRLVSEASDALVKVLKEDESAGSEVEALERVVQEELVFETAAKLLKEQVELAVSVLERYGKR